MNALQRIQMALNHQEADRVPSDLGATVMTSLHVTAYRNLRFYLGLPAGQIRLADTVQQLVEVDDDVRQRFGVDARGFRPGASAAASQAQIKSDMPGYNYFTDEWGIGWKMPKEGGFYYDVFHHPLREAQRVADIERYPWPDAADPARFSGLREKVLHTVKVQQQAAVVGGLCAGFVEMAGWMRGYQEYLIDFVNNPTFLEAFFDKILELKMTFWDKMLAEIGDIVTVVLESDDMGSQTNLLFSPQMYRKYVKPRHKQLFEFIKARTKAKILFHSCGAIRKVLPDLIEVGIDILNPLQVSAAGMDSADFKRDFGKDITVWGGGVDTQYVLGRGTVQEVKDEVRRRIDDLAPGGGFVFATVHAIQANVPPENVVAAWEALQEYGIYPK